MKNNFLNSMFITLSMLVGLSIRSQANAAQKSAKQSAKPEYKKIVNQKSFEQQLIEQQLKLIKRSSNKLKSENSESNSGSQTSLI